MHKELLSYLLTISWILTPLVFIYLWEKEKRLREKRSLERGDYFQNILSDNDVLECLRNGKKFIPDVMELDEIFRYDKKIQELRKIGYSYVIAYSMLTWMVLGIIYMILNNFM